MSGFGDSNDVGWRVKLSGRSIVATIDPGSPNTYENRGADVDGQDFDGIAVDAELTWPAGGEPTIIITPLTSAVTFVEKDAEPALTVFALEHKGNVVPRAKSPPANTGGGNVGLIVIVVGGLWLLFGKSSPLKRRRRRG